MQISHTRTKRDATRESIINLLVTWSEDLQKLKDHEQNKKHKQLGSLISWYLSSEGGGSIKPTLSDIASGYSLEGMEGSGNHVSNIYAILKDGIPRTTCSHRNPLTGIKEESALEKELYERFDCSPNARAISARLSDIRKQTKTNPSIVHAVEIKKGNGRNYKRRFYFLVEDGKGRSGSVPAYESPKWHLRKS